MPKSTVTGDREVVRLLRTLAKGPPAREVDRAANHAMAPMIEDTRRRLKAHRNFASKYPAVFPKQAKISSKHVDKDIVMRKQRAGPGQRAYRLGAVRRARYLLHLLEYGTAPHFQPNLLAGFYHPGASPLPTLTPAFNHGKDEVVWALQEELLDWTEKTVRAHGARFGRR